MPKHTSSGGEKLGLASLTLSLTTSLLALNTVAQEDPTEQERFSLEEIIITARKRFDTIQDVPISIQAKSGMEIQDKSIYSLDELSFYVPNLHVGPGTISRSIFIRGVGSGDNSGFEQTVGTYVDGVYYGRAELSKTPFFDTQRVEILKGPQSILFGKNTVAGAINITTADPTEEFSYEISGLYETEHDEQKIEGFVSGPLADDLNGRVAFKVSEIGGWLENNQPGSDDMPNEKNLATRLSLAYSGIEDLTVVAKLAVVDIDTDGSEFQLIRCSLPTQGTLLLNGLSDDCGFDDQNGLGGRYIPASGMGPGYDFSKLSTNLKTNTFSLSADYDMGDYELNSTTSFLEYDSEFFTDVDMSALSFIGAELLQDYQQFGEELRLRYIGSNRYEWLTGVYVQGSDFENISRGHFNSSQIPIPSLATPIAATTITSFEQDSFTWAAFAQVVYHFNSQWSTTWGVRYSKETKEADKDQIIAELGGSASTLDPYLVSVLTSPQFGFTQHSLSGKRSEDGVTPSINVQYTPDFDTRYYVSISSGFKGGGFDSILPNGDATKFEFDEEKVLAYEAGAKYRLFQGAASLQIALFRSDFDDVQSSTYDGLIGFTVNNAGETRSQGIEIESRARLSKALTVGLNYAYLDAKYITFENAQCYNGQTAAQGCIGGVRSLNGERTQFSPEHSVSLMIDYVATVFGNPLRTTLDVNYMSEYSVTNDLDPFLNQNGYAKINLRVAYQVDKWEVAFIGKNLTDKLTYSSANDLTFFAGSYSAIMDRPRTLALQASYRY